MQKRLRDVSTFRGWPSARVKTDTLDLWFLFLFWLFALCCMVALHTLLKGRTMSSVVYCCNACCVDLLKVTCMSLCIACFKMWIMKLVSVVAYSEMESVSKWLIIKSSWTIKLLNQVVESLKKVIWGFEVEFFFSGLKFDVVTLSAFSQKDTK